MKEYLVLARKYRPQQFSEIICQDHVTKTLTNAIKTNRVAHAYLFCGPKGIGKTTIARILAKTLNCEKGPTPTPCDKCTYCTEITSSMSMDVLEIDGASNRGIDEIRELRENVKFAAAGSRFKIYIIDEVHMLTKEAFNALLKTLEEPPAHVKFFFATTNPDKVPATILSRCQRFDLIRIPNDSIVKRLHYLIKKEEIKIANETLYTIARCANGSMRDAESTLDKLISYGGANISQEDTLNILGIVAQELLHEISEAAAQSNIEKALSITNQVFEQGKDLSQFVLDLTNHFRNILLAKYSPNVHKFIDLPKEEIEKTISLGKHFSQAQLLEIINTLIRLQGELKWSLSKRITLEIGIIKIVRTKQKISLDQLIDRLGELENRLNKPNPSIAEEYTSSSNNFMIKEHDPIKKNHPDIKHDPAPQKDDKKKHNPDSHNSLELDQINNFWHEILISLGKRNPLLKSYLAEGTPLEIKNNTLTIGFDPSCTLHQESLNKATNKELIEKRVQERLGIPIKLNFKITDLVPRKKPKEEKIIDNPLIDKVRQTFGAKIINIKTE